MSLARSRASALPLRSAPAVTPGAAGLERVQGAARLVVSAEQGHTRLVENYQSGSAKLRFPRPEAEEPFAAVFINTAGGLTGGDRLSLAVTAGANAALAVTSQAAERIYRRSAGHAAIDTTLTVEAGASLDWLPQETILFDRSALRRNLAADVDPAGRLLAVEAVVLGRTAMGETVRSVDLADSWRIRRGGRLVFADGLSLDGDATAILAGSATGRGAAALATVVLVAPDAEAALAPARAVLDSCDGDTGASAWNGILVARLVKSHGQALRSALFRLIEALRGRPLPRLWNC